jgi:hypothetical protein
MCDSSDQAHPRNMRVVYLWVAIGTFVVCMGILACVLFLTYESPRKGEASDRITIAVHDAELWLAGRGLRKGSDIESRLTEVMTDPDATNADEAREMLVRVRQEIAYRQAKQNAPAAAKRLLAEAKKLISQEKVPEAIQALRKCTGLPLAQPSGEAQALLKEAEAAISDSDAYAAIESMSDAYLEEHIRDKWELSDGKVTDPTLLKVRKQTIARAYATLMRKREESRLEAIAREQARQREIRNRIAVLETRKREYKTRTLTKVAPGRQEQILEEVAEWARENLSANDQRLALEIVKKEKQGKEIDDLCQAACSGSEDSAWFALARCTPEVLAVLDKIMHATDYGRIWANEETSIGEALLMAFDVGIARLRASLR